MRDTLTLALTTAAAELPLSLGELKAQLRLEDDQVQEDALLMAMMRSAVESCERFTGRALMTQTWTLFRDAWPGAAEATLQEGLTVAPSNDLPASGIALPKPPLQSVVHVKTYDEFSFSKHFSHLLSITHTQKGRPVSRRNNNPIQIVKVHRAYM